MTFEASARSGGFLDQGGMASTVMKGKVCPPTLGPSVPNVRTPYWSRPMAFHQSWRCGHTPKCAMYVCVCLTSVPSAAAIICLH